jgi:hypothetical protein
MDVKRTYLRTLGEDVEANLARFDEETGRFLTGGGWAVTNQDIVYPLALLYVTRDPANPYYGDERVLGYALRGADAWRDFQYPDGRVEFIKIDGSTWGPTYMPWSMYHWLETYALLRGRLDAPRRARWEEGLTLAYTGIARELDEARVHNIPTWNGMALYRAGQIFGRPEWLERGRRTIEQAVEAQTPQGYWREHHGPTTSYNLVYVHAIGLYYEFSGDERVLPCLERGTQFHIRYTYPDGRLVETIDGRVKYHDIVPDSAHAAFSLFPQGRRYVRLLVENMLKARQQRAEPRVSYAVTSGSARAVRAEYGLSARLASAYTYYHAGPEELIPQDTRDYLIHDEGHALLRRAGGWFYCLSGIVTPPVDSRWGQDRQNFCSVWHEGTGLVVGGGNSREQPEWSTFVVGAEPSAVYLPETGTLRPGEAADAVVLTYAGHDCTLEVSVCGESCLRLRFHAPEGVPARGQVLFKLNAEHPLRTGAGQELALGMERIVLSDQGAGGWVSHRGWRARLPAGSTWTWPSLPFNPYTKDGAAPLDEGAAVLSVPLGTGAVDVLIETV